MALRFEDYEGIAVVGLGVAFAVWEKAAPAHAVDRRADLRRDLLAVLVLVVGVNLSRFTLHALFKHFGLAATFATGFWNHWPLPVQMLAAMVLADASLYWIHRAMHTRALWVTHKWHHSIEQMYWLAGIRTSLVHGFLYAIPQVLIAFYLFHFTAPQLGALFAVGIFMQYWTHSNIRVGLGPLAWLVITPDYHRAHHAAGESKHGNYGVTFTIWDKLFGSYIDPKTLPKGYALGLGEDASVARMTIGV